VKPIVVSEGPAVGRQERRQSADLVAGFGGGVRIGMEMDGLIRRPRWPSKAATGESMPPESSRSPSPACHRQPAQAGRSPS